MVRIMTVHGAKGLEAPIVFLADAGAAPRRDAAACLDACRTPTAATALPFWRAAPASATACRRGVERATRSGELEEQRRLLYVALTRARDRLYVTGWLRAAARAARPRRWRADAGTSWSVMRWRGAATRR